MADQGSPRGEEGKKGVAGEEVLRCVKGSGGGLVPPGPSVAEGDVDEGITKTAKPEREDADETYWDHYGQDSNLEDAFEGLNLYGEEEDLDLS